MMDVVDRKKFLLQIIICEADRLGDTMANGA